eukprot:TRINITY_DN8133_c0_g1_i3.p1 TRINITY_DN8133_c0_g1~~TRINITY_DN8133_c0_g1_i3.p1  ORF type:complete len:100 (+),score=5.57 TRINITY_DN8133_c0_g1_i3:225-524(+)
MTAVELSNRSYIVIQILSAWLAQSVEHETLNLRVVGSSPTLGLCFFLGIFLSFFKSIHEGEESTCWGKDRCTGLTWRKTEIPEEGRERERERDRERGGK